MERAETWKVSGLRGFPLFYYLGNNQCCVGWSGIAGHVPENWQQNAILKGRLGVWTRSLHLSAWLSLESKLRHDQSGFESQKAFQPNLCPSIDAYCLLSSGPHFVHHEFFNRDGTLVNVSAIPVVVKGVFFRAQRCGKQTEEYRLALSRKSPSSFSYLVGWTQPMH